MTLSLLLPTRGRPVQLRRLFDSLVRTTTLLDELEVVLYLDENDAESQQVTNSALSLVKVIGIPGQTMGNMNRACYEASHGHYVMLLNDDVIFQTPNWDDLVSQAFAAFPDEVGLVYGNDLDQGRAVPTFPILSRTVCDVLGQICPRGYQNLHIESHLFDIFRQLAKLGHDRICYLENVVFEHMHYTLGKARIDPTYAKKNQRADDLLFLALDDERAFKARLLARHIETCRNSKVEEAPDLLSSEQQIRNRSRHGLTAWLKRTFLSQ